MCACQDFAGPGHSSTTKRRTLWTQSRSRTHFSNYRIVLPKCSGDGPFLPFDPLRKSGASRMAHLPAVIELRKIAKLIAR